MAKFVTIGNKIVNLEYVSYVEINEKGTLLVHIHGTPQTVIVDSESTTAFIKAIDGASITLKGR